MKKWQDADRTQQTTTAPSGLHPEDTKHFISRKMEWLPDWRKSDGYPAHDATSEQWAWELLRRNRYFQRDCLLVKAGKISQEKVRLAWGLSAYVPYWKSLTSSTKMPEGHIAPTRSWGTVDALIVDAQYFGPTRLLLHINPEALDASPESRDQQFAILRDFVERNRLPELPKHRTPPALPLFSKLAKYLRVADALSEQTPIARKIIAEQFHREGLILKKYKHLLVEEGADMQTRGRAAKKLDAENLPRREQARLMLAEKYSREIGSVIARAYPLIYNQGYRLLLSSDDSRTSTQVPTRKPKRRETVIGWDSVFAPQRRTPLRERAKKIDPEATTWA